MAGSLFQFDPKEDIYWQLQDALMYLDEHFRAPYNDMQSEIDAGKEAVETIKTFIAVSAFIAGVQSSLISFTFNANATPLQNATNWFAFVGLTLDIIGTSAGVVRTVHLQHIIRRTERILRRTVESLNRLRARINRLRDRAGSEYSTTEDMLKIAKQFEIQERMLREFQLLCNLSPIHAILDLAVQVSDTLSLNPLPMIVLSQILSYVLSFPQAVANQVPLISMGGGIFCLLVSFLLFTAGLQPTGIWTACVGIAGVIGAWSSLYMVFDGKGRQKRMANKNIEQYLKESYEFEH